MRNKLKNDTHFEKYVRTLTEDKKTTTFNAIRSKNHQFYSISQTKIALTSFFGNKRCWTDAINSVAYGHFSVSNWFTIIQILMNSIFWASIAHAPFGFGMLA